MQYFKPNELITYSKQDYSDEETTPQDTMVPAPTDSLMDFNTEYLQPSKEPTMPNRNFMLMGEEENLLQHSHVQVLPDGSVIEDGSLNADKVLHSNQPTS